MFANKRIPFERFGGAICIKARWVGGREAVKSVNIKFLDTLNTATSGLALVACALVSTFVNFGGALYLKVITQVGGRESSIERLDVFL